jgi:very-short-patch-repair endonuclease
MQQLIPSATKQVKDLVRALTERGVAVKTEYWDGHKHVDIFIPENGMYIEVEGIQHFTNAGQIISDLKRDYYSDIENHFTFRVTNQLIETHLEEIADAVTQVVCVGRVAKNPN